MVNKNKPPSVFRKDKRWNRKINKENIENNLVLYRLSKRICNQYQDLFFEIRYIRTKCVYFLFRLNFDFGFFINHDETDCVSEKYRKKEWM